MPRKLTDADVARMRERAATRSPAELAVEFGVSRRHVARVLHGEQRPLIAGLDRATLRRQGVSSAVERYLAGLKLDGPGLILGATVRALAAKLDAAAAADSAAAAQAAPRIAGELVDVLGRLRQDAPREPDAIDLLQRQRAARQLATARAHDRKSA